MKSARIEAFKRFMSSSASKRVIIVEDEKDVRDSIAAWMMACGLEPVSVGYAEDGIALLKSQEFQLAMVNLNLPRMTGKQFIQWCNEHKPAMPCVVVSGLEIEDIVRSCTSLKILMAIPKPLTMPDLENLLMQLQLHPSWTTPPTDDTPGI